MTIHTYGMLEHWRQYSWVCFSDKTTAAAFKNQYVKHISWFCFLGKHRNKAPIIITRNFSFSFVRHVLWEWNSGSVEDSNNSQKNYDSIQYICRHMYKPGWKNYNVQLGKTPLTRSLRDRSAWPNLTKFYQTSPRCNL